MPFGASTRPVRAPNWPASPSESSRPRRQGYEERLLTAGDDPEVTERNRRRDNGQADWRLLIGEAEAQVEALTTALEDLRVVLRSLSSVQAPQASAYRLPARATEGR